MSTYILKEEELDSFIQKNILKFYEGERKILALVGDLGAGKTTFSKKLLALLGVEQVVSSPTFSIINSYDIFYKNFTKALHVDVYRIEDSKELDVLHFDNLIQEKNTISIIEWADTIKEKIPQDAVWIYFEHNTDTTRKVTIKNA